MINIIVVFPKLEDAKSIKNVLVRSGFSAMAACTTGAQAIGLAEDYGNCIVICGYKLIDMLYSELLDCLPGGTQMLLMASDVYLSEVNGKGNRRREIAGRDVEWQDIVCRDMICQDIVCQDMICLSMPLKVHELVSTVGMMCQSMERRRRRQRLVPKERKPEDMEWIKEAKHLLMERNHMTEEEAHRYLQKCSMDSSTGMAETAKMVLAAMGQ